MKASTAKSWVSFLELEVRKAIRKAKRNGITGLSRSELWGATYIPYKNRPNSVAEMKRIFDRLIDNTVEFRQFTY